MYLSHLSLENFRNYPSLHLDLAPQRHLFHGDNAQGKTNLLEAVYLLATTRSPRTTSDSELISWSLEGALQATRVKGRVERRDGPLDLEIAMVPAQGERASTGRSGVQKRIKVNGATRRAVDAIGQLVAVWFSPQDVELVTGTPSSRRRYLDIAISQIDRRYLQSLQHYNRVLLQRNHLLRLIREGRSGPEEMAFWDGEISRSGAYLLAKRWETVARLSVLARELHLEMSEGAEDVSLSYVGTLETVTSLEEDASYIQKRLLAALEQRRQREVLAGATLVGPHRDDLRFLAGGVDMAVYGSRGQQRTAVLSLKLAELQYLEREAGEPPVLLLDDAFSELDARRRRHLLAAIGRVEQVLLTTTDVDRVDAGLGEGAMRYRIRQGRLNKE